MKLSAMSFVAALVFSVVVAENDALASSAQSTTSGTYYGATDVLVNANEHLSCPTTLQFDPKTNSATVTVNYRGTDMTTKINGSFRDGVFHGRSKGRFFGLVYVQATNYTLKFDHRSGTVKATSWLVNPTPGTNNKPQTDVYRRTPPRSQASDSDIKTSHLKDNIVEAKDTGERTKRVKSDSTVSKAKATPTPTHKK